MRPGNLQENYRSFYGKDIIKLKIPAFNLRPPPSTIAFPNAVFLQKFKYNAGTSGNT